MAKDKISPDDIALKDLWKEINEGASLFLQKSKAIREELTEGLKVQREYLKNWKGTGGSKDANGLGGATRTSDAQIKALEKQRLEEIKIEKAREKAFDDYEKMLAKKAKADAKLTAEAKKLTSVYEQNKVKLNAVSKALMELESRGRTSGKVYKALREDFIKFSTSVNAAEKSVGRFQRKVGNYPNLDKFGTSVKGIGSQLLNLAGIGGGVLLFKNAIDQIGAFDQSLADLRAILGLTADSKDFQTLQTNALVLGRTTTASAVDVVEAYKLIGSAKPELLENVDALNQVTKAAITLAEASGLELPDAATRLTDAMNQFGADASQAAYYIDVLANGAKFGSAEIPQITDALLEFGVAAKSSNVDIATSTAVIEAFAEKGLKGAEAGTAFRNILLKLNSAEVLPKEALGQLESAGVDISILSDKSLSLTERLAELSKIQGNSTAITKTFGIENAVAAETLINQRDRVAELTEKMKENGTAQQQAAERTDTLNGELKKLANAWQAALIEFGKGGGDLKNTIRFIRENLDTILTIIGKVIRAFIVYKSVVAATNAVYRSKDLIDYVKNMFKAKEAVEKTAEAQKALNRSFNASIIGLVVTALVEAADALGLFETAADRAAAAQERINAAIDKQVQKNGEYMEGLSKRIAAIRKNAELEIKLAEARGESIVEIEAKTNEELKKEYVNGLSEAVDAAGEINAKIEEAEKERNKRLQAVAKHDYNDVRKKALTEDLDEEISAHKGALEKIEEAYKDFELELESLNVDSTVSKIEQEKKVTELTKEELDKRKKAADDAFNTQLQILENNRIKSDTIAERDIEDEFRRNVVKQQANIKFLQEKLKLEQRFGRDTVKTAYDIEVALNGLEKLRADNYEARMEKQRKIADEVAEADIRLMTDQFEREAAEAKKAFNDKISQLTKDGELTSDLEIKLRQELVNKLKEITDNARKEKLNKDLEEIDKFYTELEENLVESSKTGKEFEDEALQDKINRLEEEIDLTREAGEETNKMELELAKLRREQREKNEADEKAALDKRKETFQKYSQRILELVEEEIDRENELRNQAIDNDISKRQDKIQRQQELADKGLRNTLAFEEAELAKAELRKEQQRERELKQEKALAFFKLISDGKSVQEAFLDMALAQLIAGAFYDGSERISDDLNPTFKTGKDDYIVRVDGKERVMTGAQNAKVGNISNEELADIAYDYQHGNLLPKHMMDISPSASAVQYLAGSGYDPAVRQEMKAMNNKIDRFIDVYKNTPRDFMGADEWGNLVDQRIKNGIKTITHAKPKL